MTSKEEPFLVFSLKISQVEVKEVEQVTFPAQETIDQVADGQHCE